MITHDKWGSTFTLLLHSRYASLLTVLIFSLPLIVSMIIHGFIIASFLDEIIRIKKQDVLSLQQIFLHKDFASMLNFRLGLLDLIKKVASADQGSVKVDKDFFKSCCKWLRAKWLFLKTSSKRVPKTTYYNRSQLMSKAFHLAHMRLHDRIDSLLVLLNTVLLLTHDLSKRDNPKLGTRCSPATLSMLITVFFIGWTCLRLFATGWANYFPSFQNKLDFALALACSVGVD